MKIYLLYKYTTDIEKAYVDSAWDSAAGAKRKGTELIEKKFHVYIEPIELEEEKKTLSEVAKESFGESFKPQVEPYEEYDYHYSPCEEYGNYDTPWKDYVDPYRTNSFHPFWDI